jgi:hypothetical protein
MSVGSIEKTGSAVSDKPSMAGPPQGSVVMEFSRCRSVDFGERLQGQCAQFATALARRGTVSLSCVAVAEQLPWLVAIQLGWVAQRLIAQACHAFDPGQGGRIAVSFRTSVDELELAVEHSHSVACSVSSAASMGSPLLLNVVARLGGKLESPEVLAGVRVIVTLPRQLGSVLRGAA